MCFLSSRGNNSNETKKNGKRFNIVERTISAEIMTCKMRKTSSNIKVSAISTGNTKKTSWENDTQWQIIHFRLNIVINMGSLRASFWSNSGRNAALQPRYPYHLWTSFLYSHIMQRKHKKMIINLVSNIFIHTHYTLRWVYSKQNKWPDELSALLPIVIRCATVDIYTFIKTQFNHKLRYIWTREKASPMLLSHHFLSLWFSI